MVRAVLRSIRNFLNKKGAQMQFHSVGAVKVGKIRKDALSVLFLFDSTVDRNIVKRTRSDLLQKVPYCRGTSWGLSGNTLKTTALSGVKNNKHYVAHTCDIMGFNQSNSSKDWYFYGNTTDGLSQDTIAYRYVTVTVASSKSTISDAKANYIGAGYGKVYDPLSAYSQNRMYFVPETIVPSMRVAATGGIRANPDFGGSVLPITKSESSTWLGWNYTYTLQWSSGAYLPQTNTLQTQLNLTTTDTSKSYGQGNTLPAVSPSMYTANAPCIMLIAMQEEQQSWPIGGGTVRFSYLPYVSDWTVKLAEPLYVPLNTVTADSPPCVLSFGAIAYEYPIEKGMILLSVGDADTDDLKQTGTNIAEVASLTLSDSVLAYANTVTKYLL